MTSWKDLEAVQSKISKKDFRIAIEFLSRFEIAHKFRAISTPGTSLALNEGYFVLLKISLAWSAMDRLIALTGRKDGFTISNPGVSMALSKGDLEQLISALRPFDGGPNDNGPLLRGYKIGHSNTKLNNLAKAIRNSMFHGSLNPTKSGLASSSKRRTILLGLATSILTACESEFDRFISNARDY